MPCMSGLREVREEVQPRRQGHGDVQGHRQGQDTSILARSMPSLPMSERTGS